ncbi:MAG: polysaccharide biosynthesis protein [Verrucomicrobiota bacterium]|nr:polysaccharide biosynthesis protein [Verrucomicrobiota bacterium]
MSFFGPISTPALDDASAPLIRQALHRARVVGSFAFAQAAVQAIGFVSGILLVRQLEQREYAYFTIANTMQGTINVLADIGISIGLVSIGGRVWQDRNRFGQLIVTALHLRRKLGAIAILAVTPLLYILLARNGAPVGYAVTLIALILLGLYLQFTIGVLSVVPRLHSDIRKIQWIDLTGSLARLGVLCALLFIFLNAGVAIAIGAGASLLQYLMLRKYAARVVDLHALGNMADRQAMRGFIRNQAANAIFFCLQGQITVFLISFFGRQANSVAEVGALGRLAMIFAVLSNLLTNVFAPAFARCQSPRRLRWQYAAVVGAVAGFSLVVLGVAAFFPRVFLLVLGSKYAHLERELVLMVAGSVAGALTGTFWALNSSKAWIAGSWLYIPLTLGTQAALIPFTDFSSVRGVLLFNLVSTLPNLLLNCVLSYRGFRSLRLATA